MRVSPRTASRIDILDGGLPHPASFLFLGQWRSGNSAEGVPQSCPSGTDALGAALSVSSQEAVAGVAAGCILSGLQEEAGSHWRLGTVAAGPAVAQGQGS